MLVRDPARRRRRGQLVGLQSALHPGRRGRRPGRRGHLDLRLARHERPRSSTGASTRPSSSSPTLTLDDGADLIFTVHNQAPGAGRRDHRRHRGDHHRRAPAARHGRRRQAPVPGDRGQRRRDQVGLRQRLRHRPVLARRHPARHQRAARRQELRRRRLRPLRPRRAPCGPTGMGANVIVTEVKPTAALQGPLEGIQVMTMDEAAQVGDIFITATGMKDVIVDRHFEVMKDGAIVCNTGHYDCEINLDELEGMAKGKRDDPRPTTRSTRFADGRRIYVLAQGRLVNLAAAEGHPVRGDGHDLRQPVPRAAQAAPGRPEHDQGRARALRRSRIRRSAASSSRRWGSGSTSSPPSRRPTTPTTRPGPRVQRRDGPRSRRGPLPTGPLVVPRSGEAP